MNGFKAVPPEKIHPATVLIREEILVNVKHLVRLMMCWGAGLLLQAGAAGASSIDVGSATAVPGQDIGFSVTLNDMGARYAATKNDVGVDPSTPLISCERNPDLNKPATTFSFQPSGCEPGVNCIGVRALVLSFGNLDRIPNGSVLYTCLVHVTDDAPEETFPLTCSLPDGSDRDGNTIPTDCTNGSIRVTRTTPTPTATPEIPTPAVTSDRLADNMGTEDLDVPLVDASQFPDAGTVVIDGEILRYRAKDGNTLIEVSRGQFGTPVSGHLTGALVTFLMTEGGGGGGGGGCAVGEGATGGSWSLIAIAAALLCMRARRRTV
jgi:hypothetical protein